MVNVRAVALEVAAAATERLTGKATDKKAIADAVDGTLKSKG